MNLEHLTCEPEERAVVGACISFEAAHCLNLLTVDPKMLYDQQLGDLLGAAIELHRKDRQVTTQAVARHLADGGAPFADMFRLAISVEGDACTKYSFDALSGIVMNRYARRQAYAAMRRSMAALEAGEDDDATSATSDAVAALSGVYSARDEPTIIAAAAEKAFLTAEDARKNGRKPGIQISLRLWNEAMGGLKAPRLIVIGARPGVGKSALAAQIAMDVANQGRGVLFWSGEMADEELGNRRLASDTGVSAKEIDQASYTEHEAAKLAAAVHNLEGKPLYIDDRPGISVRDLEARARWVAARSPLGLIVVDYLQLMKADGRHRSREQAVAEISRALKRLAKSMGVCVIAVSQLNRKCEERADHKPVISDLRESGQLEQDADTICFVYRHVIYDENADPTKALVLVRKNRGGTIGEIPLQWDGPAQRFTDGEW